jgi:hypothetical protein
MLLQLHRRGARLRRDRALVHDISTTTKFLERYRLYSKTRLLRIFWHDEGLRPSSLRFRHPRAEVLEQHR